MGRYSGGLCVHAREWVWLCGGMCVCVRPFNYVCLVQFTHCLRVFMYVCMCLLCVCACLCVYIVFVCGGYIRHKLARCQNYTIIGCCDTYHESSYSIH